MKFKTKVPSVCFGVLLSSSLCLAQTPIESEIASDQDRRTHSYEVSLDPYQFDMDSYRNWSVQYNFNRPSVGHELGRFYGPAMNVNFKLTIRFPIPKVSVPRSYGDSKYHVSANLPFQLDLPSLKWEGPSPVFVSNEFVSVHKLRAELILRPESAKRSLEDFRLNLDLCRPRILTRNLQMLESCRQPLLDETGYWAAFAGDTKHAASDSSTPVSHDIFDAPGAAR